MSEYQGDRKNPTGVERGDNSSKVGRYEDRELIDLVDALYMDSDSKIFKTLHQIANLAMEQTNE